MVTDGRYSRLLALVATWYGALPVLLVTSKPEGLPPGVTAVPTDGSAAGSADLAARLKQRPAVAAVELSGRAESVDLLLEALPPASRLMLAGPAARTVHDRLLRQRASQGAAPVVRGVAGSESSRQRRADRCPASARAPPPGAGGTGGSLQCGTRGRSPFMINVLHLRDTDRVCGPGKTILETACAADRREFTHKIGLFLLNRERTNPYQDAAAQRGVEVVPIRSASPIRSADRHDDRPYRQGAPDQHHPFARVQVRPAGLGRDSILPSAGNDDRSRLDPQRHQAQAVHSEPGSRCCRSSTGWSRSPVRRAPPSSLAASRTQKSRSFTMAS